ncbi:hypothetical protein X773_09455 [Mesorhizobium sp. LSJC285A00]|nr:hypothetical protein X773_09455 [Mesorhizobium sp. LSJC285A00]
MMPITAAQVPPDGFSDALFNAVCRIFALSVPIIPVIWADNAAWAAS